MNDKLLQQLEESGFAIFADAIGEELLDELDDGLHADQPGRRIA
jgi:hypothetical protein